MAGTAATTERLRQVPLFNGLSKRDLRRLAGKVRERRYKQGTAVVQEGKMSGIGFFVITDGEASVQVGGKEVSRLGPGDHFGELALINEDARTASVTAVTRLRCHVIPFWDFRKFARDNPDVAWKLLQHVAALLVAERARSARAALSVA
jgi:CRP-like cAMP-binding protein